MKKLASLSLIAAGVVVAFAASGDPAPSASTPSSPPSNQPPTSCPEGMALIPAGVFTPEGGKATPMPAFCMDKTEVTVIAYDACVAAGKCKLPGIRPACNEGRADRVAHPVNCVDWFDSAAYCAWAGKRLPTEVQWEYAARGTDGREYPWGKAAPDDQLCWAKTSHESTCAVGSFPSGNSPFGLSDMSGNVWEWTSSREGNARVNRGGCWDYDGPSDVRAASRFRNAPSFRIYNLGFRCSR